MSVLQYEGYLKKLRSSQDDYSVETLRLQRKFLYSIYSHHRLWAQHTDDEEIGRHHAEAAEMVQKTINQYDQLLEKYYLNNSDV